MTIKVYPVEVYNFVASEGDHNTREAVDSALEGNLIVPETMNKEEELRLGLVFLCRDLILELLQGE